MIWLPLDNWILILHLRNFYEIEETTEILPRNIINFTFALTNELAESKRKFVYLFSREMHINHALMQRNWEIEKIDLNIYLFRYVTVFASCRIIFPLENGDKIYLDAYLSVMSSSSNKWTCRIE